MGVQWTKDQQKVIALRGRSILVSAAAGSGKTAVLVQRILSRIMDPEHPIDVDRILIMTFTRAAAGEMKDRLMQELEKALYEDPDNSHLQKQMNLIHTAQITTIDGFCAYVIRNYFHLIDLDPGYRVADEGELKLVKQDVLDQLLDASYEEGEEAFHRFVECLCPGKSDDGLRDQILKLYEASQSEPYPEEWLRHCLDGYQDTVENGDISYGWFELLWTIADEQLKTVRSRLEEARRLCLDPAGPWTYEEAIADDLTQIRKLETLTAKKDYSALYEALQGISFVRLSSKKNDADERLKKQTQALRNEAKDLVKELRETYFSMPLQNLKYVMLQCRQTLQMLVKQTLKFAELYTARKREKNLLDFSDMEHFALQILGHENEDGVFVPSAAARELSEKYEEVMVDEYQDSNLVQEIITRWVSGWAKDEKNIFMVGDVKQSIYRFRQAKPELFMEKYHTFTETDSTEQRVDLHQNFRSRASVLESVNYLFRQLMGEDLGGITYDEAAALYPAAQYPEGESESFIETELLLVDQDDPEYEDSDTVGTAQELEALSIAQRIHEMVGKEQVYDRKTDGYRPLEYGDIAILLRSFSGWGETFAEVLSSQGIPVYAASRSGYFSATEVMTVLNYLRVADNPRQDIPLLGVLRSPIVGCRTEELAYLKSEYPKGLLWDSIEELLNDGQMSFLGETSVQESLKGKIAAFAEDLALIREQSAYTPVHQLILTVLDKTGYDRMARALPDGEQRCANLRMLVEKAMEYEKTSYRGLFNFIRYIEQLQKYEVDFGEVNLSDAGLGAVQIMTTHKSKGLEFPVVFAAGMNKQFNLQDINAGILIHPKLGIGMDAVIPEIRLKLASPYKRVIRQQLLNETLGEELRILYVALTRAREKLIISGTVGKLSDRLQQYSAYANRTEECLPCNVRQSAKKCWDWIFAALSGHRCLDELYEANSIFVSKNPRLHEDISSFKVRVMGAKELTLKELGIQAEAELQRMRLEQWDPEQVYDAEIRKELSKRFSYRYEADWLREIPVKISVSELKKRSYEEEEFAIPEYAKGSPEAGAQELADTDEEDVIVPRFIREKTETVYHGAERGTAYHKVMECLNYERTENALQVELQIEEMQRAELLSERQAQSVALSDIRTFLKSALGQRMKAAALDRKLVREQPFMIERMSEELDPSWHEGVPVIVQGIIDAYFVEDDEIVLVDYKTDRVRRGEEQRLIDLYHVQLEDYTLALERMTGRKVRETYIYSFALGKEIALQH